VYAGDPDRFEDMYQPAGRKRPSSLNSSTKKLKQVEPLGSVKMAISTRRQEI
jgi:hypothetical protein